ncbi:unnamed protein product [Peniophora sp. CBMAI 1063]|nr:unnamed protein product [Peniophora sp. CBMAI 1063]
MGAFDPSYPLLPISCIIGAVMMVLVLMTSFVRQTWNLGVAFLCFWLLMDLTFGAAGLIIWSDNGDIRLYVFCDIASHLQLMSSVVKPMATLIITRRLYLIARLQSVELPGNTVGRRDVWIEWTLGLGIPLLVAGPLYFIVQDVRFAVFEGFGCTNAANVSILSLLLVLSWGVVPPLLSIIFYYPRVAKLFYRQRRAINQFSRSDNSVSSTNYLRILVLASLDLIFTLPVGILSFALYPLESGEDGALPFFPGWTSVHTDWAPRSISYAKVQASGPLVVARTYFIPWTAPVLAFAIFGLFGLTREARASYRRALYTAAGWLGWKVTPRHRLTRSSLGVIEFGERPADLSVDAESGTHSGLEGAHTELHRDEMEDDERVVGGESEKIAMTEDCSSSSAEVAAHAKSA